MQNKIKTDNFEIKVHDSLTGYYVNVRTKDQLVSVFRTHIVVYGHTVVYENNKMVTAGKALVHVHTIARKVEVVKDMEIIVTDEP